MRPSSYTRNYARPWGYWKTPSLPLDLTVVEGEDDNGIFFAVLTGRKTGRGRGVGVGVVLGVNARCEDRSQGVQQRKQQDRGRKEQQRAGAGGQ